MTRYNYTRGVITTSFFFLLHILNVEDVVAFGGQTMLPEVSSTTSTGTTTSTSCSAALTSSLETPFPSTIETSKSSSPSPVEEETSPKSKVAVTATATVSARNSDNSHKNMFGESFVLLSRAAEVSSIALGTVTPLLISGLSSTVFSNRHHKDYISLGDPSTTTTSTKEDKDPWEMFWSIHTSKHSIAGLHVNGIGSSGDEDDDTVSNAHRVVEALQKLGPTYVKFGQALASRPDIIPQPLAEALSTLQDSMEPFDTDIAKQIIEEELFFQPKKMEQQSEADDDTTFAVGGKDDIQSLIDSLSDEPVAAASVGQVYKGYLPNYGAVAVKVKRPGIKALVEKDFVLLRSLASLAESIPSFDFKKKNDENANGKTNNDRFVNTELVAGVDEFMSRIFEELNYENEAANAKKFAELYCKKNGSRVKSLPNGEGVIVPEIITALCTENVIVMEWIEGSKLTSIGETANGQVVDRNSVDANIEIQENLALVEQALYVTLSQLLDTGVMHADPHGGNLLKVSTLSSSLSSKSLSRSKKQIPTLAYLDFGLLATIPETVRDGLVCSVASLVFSKDVDAVASLFGELDLLPEEVINDPFERKALTEALTKTMEEVLRYPPGETLFSPSMTSSSPRMSLSRLGRRINLTGSRSNTAIPSLEFDKLLDGLTRLVPRFKFRLPPYFINNARALGTLEGTARSLDPDFNCLKLLYPYALYRLLQNPSGSPVVQSTLQSLIRSDTTGRIDREKVRKLLRDTSLFTGYSKAKVFLDIIKTKGGKRLIAYSMASELNHMLLKPMIRRSKRIGLGGKHSAYLQL